MKLKKKKNGRHQQQERVKNSINKFALAPKIQSISKVPKHGLALSQCLNERKNTKLEVEI